MIKAVTSVTIFNDAVGMRMSITFSEIDEETGKIISDNNRIDRVIAKPSDKNMCNSVLELAQSYIDS